MDQSGWNYLWDSFWAEHANSESVFHYLLWRIRFLFSRAYAARIFKYMGKPGAASALEVGCGSARTLHYLGGMIAACRCTAFDLSPIAIQIVRKISPTFTSGIANAFDLPLPGGLFNSCFSIGLIEHFSREQAAQIVSEKVRVVRPGGVVGIMVPWKSSVYNLIVRKAFGARWPFGEENPFRRQELTDFMHKLNLKEIEIHVVYGSVLLGLGRKEA